jgi:putative endonuclease
LSTGIGRPTRRQAERFGRRAEAGAAWLLRLKGFRILQTRYRNAAGEIDLIARRRNLLVFVEVKARDDLDAAAHAISPHQQQRIARAGEIFLAHSPELANLDMRLDAVLVAPWRLPVHIPGAWRLS